MIGFAVMRLQPIHKGHQKIIESMLNDNEQVFLLLGSTDKHNKDNPFTYEERKEMVETIYKQYIDDGKLKLFPIEDIDESLDWVDHVLSKLPKRPDCYYCGSGQDGETFLKKGFKLKEFDRKILNISSTMIREKIRNNDSSWKNFVSEKILYLIEKKNI